MRPAVLKQLVDASQPELSADQAQLLFSCLLSGDIGEIEMGAVLTALAMRPLSVATLNGLINAAQSHQRTINVSTFQTRPLVIASHTGTAQQANLMPLLALLAARFGLTVFVHGTLESAGTTTSAAIFRELDILPCANLRDVSQALESHGIAWVPSALFSPALMQTDALRHRLGFSNCAHAVAAHLDPFQGRGLRLVAAHDATHAEQLAQLLLLRGETALLFEGVEGEAFANPLQRPAIMYVDAGVQHTLFSEETSGTHSARHTRLPESSDARTTAHWTEEVLAGRVPLPSPISHLLACCLYAAGYSKDFNQSKAMVAVRTHHLAVA